MICQGSTCRSGRAPCKSPALCRAMHAPILAPGTYVLREQATAPKRIAARRARSRRHLFLTLAVLGALILARLVLRSIGVI